MAFQVWRTSLIAAAIILLPALAKPVNADAHTGPDPAPTDAEHQLDKKYAKLFGPDEERAGANNKAAARFAGKLVAALTSLADDKEMSILLCQKAVLFGMKDSDGYSSALAALKRLQDLQPTPSRAIAAQQNDAYRLIYTKARESEVRADAGAVLLELSIAQTDELSAARRYSDALKSARDAFAVASAIRSPRQEEVSARTKSLQAKLQLTEKADALASKLAAQSGDQAVARQLMEIYLLDLDDPVGAASAVGDSLGAPTRSSLELAAKADADLSEGDRLTLARWYRDLAKRVIATNARSAALNHSMDQYDAWLDTHAKKDADRLAVAAEAVAFRMQNKAELSGVYADRVVFWNTNNGGVNDRGTDVVNVILLSRGRPVWRKDAVQIPWTPGAASSTSVPIPRVRFERVRIEIIRWKGKGGGLDEVEVDRNGRNIALGAATVASGAWRADYGPQNLVDGVITPAAAFKGSWMWLLPDGTDGWAEIDLSGSAVRTARGQQD